MPVTEIRKDPATLTLTVLAEFAVPVERVWAAYVDPRQIERFWGPPGWPATFERHDVVVGGRSSYYMAGPDGQKSRGYWEWVRISPPTEFEVRDGFANEDGTPNEAMGAMRMHVRFASSGAGTQMTVVSTFPSREVMESHLKMGLEEGLRAAMGQIDAVLAA